MPEPITLERLAAAGFDVKGDAAIRFARDDKNDPGPGIMVCPDCGAGCEFAELRELDSISPYPVRCARCGAPGTSDDMTPVECDEWECLACFERLSKAEAEAAR